MQGQCDPCCSSSLAPSFTSMAAAFALKTMSSSGMAPLHLPHVHLEAVRTSADTTVLGGTAQAICFGSHSFLLDNCSLTGPQDSPLSAENGLLLHSAKEDSAMLSLEHCPSIPLSCHAQTYASIHHLPTMQPFWIEDSCCNCAAMAHLELSFIFATQA